MNIALITIILSVIIFILIIFLLFWSGFHQTTIKFDPIGQTGKDQSQCSTNQACSREYQCDFGLGVCKRERSSACSSYADCMTGDYCNNGYCTNNNTGWLLQNCPCNLGLQCSSDNLCRYTQGNQCSLDVECYSNQCSAGVCK